jgi:NADH:ubiquinone oxidoreductase subunit E
MMELEYLRQLDSHRSNLIKGLQAVQEKEGFISDQALRMVGEYFSVPVVEVEGVVSFYAQFKRTKPGKYQLALCDGTACHIKGSTLILDWVRTELGIKEGETDTAGLFSLETVACLGCCSLAPVMSINRRVYAKLDRKNTIKILKEYRKNG